MPLHIAHPFWMVTFLVLTAVTFSLLGFIIGIWADGFEKLQIVPLLIITPLTFLGGTFYSTSVLPPLWQTIALFNPVVYLISGFRWSFFEISDVSHGISVGMTLLFLLLCLVDGLVDVQDRLQTQEITCVPEIRLSARRQARPERLMPGSQYRRYRMTVAASLSPAARARKGVRHAKEYFAAMAQTIASAALAKCESMGFKVSVTVLDRGRPRRS